MGLFSGSTKTKTTETSNTGPSEFQRPYLDQTFGAAKDIYSGAKDTPYYQGEMYAGMSAEAKDALTKLKSYASTMGLGNATALSSIGSGLIGNYDKASSTLDQFTKLAGTDATSSYIEAAQRYVDNPFVQSQINANSRDVTRNLTEDTLPTSIGRRPVWGTSIPPGLAWRPVSHGAALKIASAISRQRSPTQTTRYRSSASWLRPRQQDRCPHPRVVRWNKYRGNRLRSSCCKTTINYKNGDNSYLWTVAKCQALCLRSRRVIRT